MLAERDSAHGRRVVQLVKERKQSEAERDALAAELAQVRAQLTQSMSVALEAEGDYQQAQAERDDLASKLEQAQAELHDLRIRAGLGEPDPLAAFLREGGKLSKTESDVTVSSIRYDRSWGTYYVYTADAGENEYDEFGVAIAAYRVGCLL